MAREAVVCEPLRTPVGRFGGVFRDVGASVLAATVIAELVRRTGLSGEDVERSFEKLEREQEIERMLQELKERKSLSA